MPPTAALHAAAINDKRAVENLPQAYALALWLRDMELDDSQIAEVLEIEYEAVGPLIRIAQLKLERMRAVAANGSGEPRPPDPEPAGNTGRQR